MAAMPNAYVFCDQHKPVRRPAICIQMNVHKRILIPSVYQVCKRQLAS